MRSVTPCRLIIDPPSPGAWNMAVDEWLLRAAAEQGVATLRFYEWQEPTLSLGYFQRYADRQQHAASRACPVVRRASGGGALVHDRELTYSITIPAGHPLARRAEDLYRAVHQSLVEVLQTQVSATAGKFELCAATDPRTRDEPFLCFSRRAEGDLLFAPHGAQERIKICGSAQRRHAGAVLQHGGVLLAASPCAPELPGLRETAGQAELPPRRLREIWTARLGRQLGLELTDPQPLDGRAKGAVERTIADRFSNPAWTRRR